MCIRDRIGEAMTGEEFRPSRAVQVGGRRYHTIKIEEHQIVPGSIDAGERR